MIRLYEASETAFDSNGLGALAEADTCKVTENRNGEYSLTLTYPVNGAMFPELKNNRIIFVKPNPYADPQPFRIYRISTPFKQEVAVYANHISYDLSGVPVSPFTASSAVAAMQGMEDNAAVDSPFTFFTDKVTNAQFSVTVPSSSRAMLGGQSGSLLDVYGGEYEFDRFQVKLLQKRGANNGVSIRYGKNLTDVNQEANISSLYTGIYPYWQDQDDYLELPEKIVHAEGTFEKQKIQTVDLSDKFEEKPTVDELREAAQQYLTDNDVGVPTVNITVSFVALDQTEEYKDIALLEKVMLCDDVNVEFPALGISATAECVTTEYDAILDRYTSITLGEATATIADTIAGNEQEIKEKPSYSFLDKAVNNATNWITGTNGGYVVLHKNEAGQPYELLIMDTPDIMTATKVWRWNQGGLGYSENGYNGPYSTAITQDGSIVANFITSGIMNAGIIKAGLLKGNTGNAYFNLDTGELAADKLIATDEDDTYLMISSNAYAQSGLTLIHNDAEAFQILVPNGSNPVTFFYFPQEIRFNKDATTTALRIDGNNQAIETTTVLCDKVSSGQSYVNSCYIGMQTNAIRLNATNVIATGSMTVSNTLSVNGTLIVNGNKNRAVETSQGTVLMSAYETASPYFGDIGSGVTDEAGACVVEIDPLFLETVSTDAGYVVFLQKCGPGDLWVESKEAGRFTVRGTAGLSFDYEVKARQKGYENHRMERMKDHGTGS